MPGKTCRKANLPPEQFCLNCRNPGRKLKCSSSISETTEITETLDTSNISNTILPAKRCPPPIERLESEAIPDCKRPALPEKAQRRGLEEVEKIIGGKLMNLMLKKMLFIR